MITIAIMIDCGCLAIKMFCIRIMIFVTDVHFWRGCGSNPVQNVRCILRTLRPLRLINCPTIESDCLDLKPGPMCDWY